LAKQEHVVKLPDGSVARVTIITTGLLRKKSDIEFDFSACSEHYMREAWARLSHIIVEKVKKRPVELHFHFPSGFF